MGHHDLFFKETFSIREHAVDFFRHVLPSDLAKSIDFDKVELEKDSHVDSKLSEYFSDTVYSARFFDTDISIALLLERSLVEFFELGRSVFREKRGLKFLESVIVYLYRATDIETDKIIRSVSEINVKGGSIAMSTAERLKQEGRKEGRKEGVKVSIISLVRNAKRQGMSEETIAGIVGLDLAAVNEILNREDFEVPLHLLQLDEKT